MTDARHPTDKTDVQFQVILAFFCPNAERLCGENAGSKLEKARSLGVTVLTPAQFFEMARV